MHTSSRASCMVKSNFLDSLYSKVTALPGICIESAFVKLNWPEMLPRRISGSTAASRTLPSEHALPSVLVRCTLPGQRKAPNSPFLQSPCMLLGRDQSRIMALIGCQPNITPADRPDAEGAGHLILDHHEISWGPQPGVPKTVAAIIAASNMRSMSWTDSANIRSFLQTALCTMPND